MKHSLKKEISFMDLNYQTYRDKVLGCYVGKSVGGTFGAPYEGMKQRLDVPFDKSVVDGMLVNDDLDLQLLFFSAVKRYGEYVSPDILARYFCEKYDFSAGEYAYFKKNYERGIMPPYSGVFNNYFYSEGMGAVIRGELWGCLFPCDPERAMEYACRDGILDHSQESVVSIMFLSALVSIAFEGVPIEAAVSKAAERLPAGKFRAMAEETISYCRSELGEEDIYNRVISRYGHPDCTNVFQNVAFVIIGVMRKFGDFAEMCRMVNGFGYDTDCTVGICGALYGIYNGGETLLKTLGRGDVPLVTMAKCYDYGGSIKAFSYDIARYGAYFSEKHGNAMEGAEKFDFTPEKVPYFRPVVYSPALAPGESQTVEFLARDLPPFSEKEVEIIPPKGYNCIIKEIKTVGKDTFISLVCSMEQSPFVNDVSEFSVRIGKEKFSFGFATPVTYRVSRPFLTLPYNIDVKKYSRYYDFFDGAEGNKDENIRKYHLSFVADYNTRFIDVNKFESVGSKNLFTDVFRMSDFTDCLCPCVVYVKRKIFSREERKLRIMVGCDDGMEIYLNGELIVKNDEVGMYYPEKRFAEITLEKGSNEFVYRLTRTTSQDATYSVIFTERGKLLDFPKFALGLKNE
ncbi:MAG: ADP-ribosylglycohydrolase family protein [Clostridia bacterium]|nr:ADP-ribosylglycohydrolase family protein [Clostridia bacterium]